MANPFSRFNFLVILCFLVINTQIILAHEGLHSQIRNADLRLKLQPDSPKILFDRAALYRQHRDYHKALSDVSRLESLAPFMLEPILLKARILIDLERYVLARKSLEQFISAKPASVEAYLLRSKLNHYTEKGAQAVSDAQMVIRLSSPKTPLVHYLHLIKMERKYGTEESTGKAFGMAQQVFGALPSLLNAKAEWLAKIGKPQQASLLYAKVREMNPNLSFVIWLKELEMWKTVGATKRAHQARLQAKKSWEALSPNIRQRKAMLEQYNTL